MAEDPQALRRDIEQTRRQVGDDVDALADKVSPRQIAHRRADAARGRLSSMRHSVMGTAEHAGTSVQDAGGKVGELVGSAPAAAKERTRGAPLAAGLVAFAAGWVLAAALPPSTKERELAATVKDNAVEPLKEQAGQVAQELKENLAEPAQEAVEHVKESATQAAAEVQDDARSAAGDVKSQAQDSADSVRPS
jgi:gas vesicle protein